MIKNNLNIAQQVNCSGISSSLFLFFDSKALHAGSVLHESRPGCGVWDFLEQSLCGLFQGQTAMANPSVPRSNIPHVAKPYCQQRGRGTWDLSLPTKLFGIANEKRNKGKNHRSPSQPNLGGVRGRRGGSQQRLLCHHHKPDVTALVPNSCVSCSKKNYNSREPATHLKAIIALGTIES